MKSIQEAFIEVSTDSSEEREDEEMLEEMEERKTGGATPAMQKQGSTKAGVVTKEDFVVDDDMIETSSTKRPVKDRDLFNLDGTSGEETKQAPEEESSEEELDLSQIEPSKVNWFKYILDKYLKLTDEDGNQTALNTADAYVNLLNILLTPKKSEEIQEDLLSLVGFHNFELLEKLIERRDIIKEQCKGILEKMQVDK